MICGKCGDTRFKGGKCFNCGTPARPRLMSGKLHKNDCVSLVAVPRPVIDLLNALMAETPETLAAVSSLVAKRSRDEVRPETERGVLRVLAALLHDMRKRNERKAAGWRLGVLECPPVSLAVIVSRLEERRAHYQQERFRAKDCGNERDARYYLRLECDMQDALDCVRPAVKREERQ